jgi:uncharacterized DUF497 family protein
MPYFEKCDWDPAKSDEAVRKGRKPFAEMAAIFFQPGISKAVIIEGYSDPNTGERRFQLLHPFTDGKPYQVVFAQRDAITRIISASRTATRVIRNKGRNPAIPKQNLARVNITMDDDTLIGQAVATVARSRASS